MSAPTPYLTIPFHSLSSILRNVSVSYYVPLGHKTDGIYTCVFDEQINARDSAHDY